MFCYRYVIEGDKNGDGENRVRYFACFGFGLIFSFFSFKVILILSVVYLNAMI